MSLRVPRRGPKRTLQETVARNAEQSLVQHKLKRSSDLTTRSQALEEIREYLGLAEPPLRIECFDVSNLQGTQIVASMVVFEDGLPRKSDYRRFVVRGLEGQSDVGAMREVLTRRFRQACWPTGTRPPRTRSRGRPGSSPTRRASSWSTEASRRWRLRPRC